jgi:hypothetical protein
MNFTPFYLSWTFLRKLKNRSATASRKQKGVFMKKKFLVSGLLALALVFGLALTACGGGAGGGPSGPYTLSWGAFYYSWAGVKSTISGLPWGSNVTYTDSGSAGWAKGTDADAIYIYSLETIGFDDGGAVGGEWADLVAYTKDGIGAPAQLKAAMLANEVNAPVAGIYDANSYDPGLIIIYCIKKN